MADGIARSTHRRKGQTAGQAAKTKAETPISHGGVTGAQLRALVERIERLAEEKQAIADDIKQVYAEAKAGGFDTKALRRVIALRKQDAAERAEFEAILDLYCQALGMTPLEEAIEDAGAAEAAG